MDNSPPERLPAEASSGLSPEPSTGSRNSAPDRSREVEAPLPPPPWSMYTVTVSLGVGYILMPLFGANALLLVYPLMPPMMELLVQQGMTLLTWIAIFTVLRLAYGPLNEFLGLRWRRSPAYYAWEALKLLLCSTGLTLLLNQFWQMLAQHFPQWSPPLENPYARYNHPELLLLSMFAVLVAPVLEEIIFRGLVQSTFQKSLPPGRAILMTCLVFLLFHGNYFDNVRALSHVLALGLCFGLWRAKTQSVLPGIIAHLCNNFLASVILLSPHKL